MPKVFVRTQPKSGLKIRHRCAMGFTDVWKEIDIDDATRAALEEDPYLEVSEKPTVMVEVAAAVQAVAPEAPIEPITPESTAAEDSTQGNDESVLNGAGVESAESSGGEVENVGANDNSPAQADGNADAAAENATDLRIEAIKAAIAQLDPNNAEHWLKDGRPSTAALESVGGLIVTAAERDSVWASLNRGVE